MSKPEIFVEIKANFGEIRPLSWPDPIAAWPDPIAAWPDPIAAWPDPIAETHCRTSLSWVAFFVQFQLCAP